jgi:hypothetical protein
MDTLAIVAPFLGIAVLLAGAVLAVYGLIFTRLEAKRVISVVGLLFFCGVFLLLFERISQLELPGALGKITLEAKQDAKQIRAIRQDMEVQQQRVGQLVSDMQQTSEQVALLAGELDDKVAVLRSERIDDRVRYLQEQIRLLEKSIPIWEGEKHRAFADRQQHTGFQLEQKISEAWAKLDDYYRELEELRKAVADDALPNDSE